MTVAWCCSNRHQCGSKGGRSSRHSNSVVTARTANDSVSSSTARTTVAGNAADDSSTQHGRQQRVAADLQVKLLIEAHPVSHKEPSARPEKLFLDVFVNRQWLEDGQQGRRVPPKLMQQQ